MGKLVHISSSKYRALLSEVLPYERPIFFSNRSFVRFLERYGVRTEGGRLVATKNQEAGLDEFLQIIGGANGDKRISFQYEISRGQVKDQKDSKMRCLTVIHPYHQVEIAEFYERYRMLLIDFCNRSQSSLRYPVKLAERQESAPNNERLIFDRDSNQRIDEGLKHYFTYERCENINYFYESNLFYQAEKQFSKMYKTDLESCFESIRIEDLAISVFGRELEQCEGSFVSHFAELQKQFRVEDNGIVIGPEFSRIYAEMILQHVDEQVDVAMRKTGCQRGVDYMFYRYVDDGFLFFNEAIVQKKLLKCYEEILCQYGLQLNPKKKKLYEQRPFVDAIATIKSMVADIVDELLVNRLTTFVGFTKMQKGVFDTPAKVDSSRFIRLYRLALQSGNGEVAHKDITVYTLGLIHNHVERILLEFNKIYRQYVEAEVKGILDDRGMEIKKQYEREFLDYMRNVVEIEFFLLSCDTRMVTSMRVVSMTHTLQLFVRGFYRFDDGLYSSKFPTFIINALDEVISRETRLLYSANAQKADTTMELLNLLNLQRKMNPNARISEDVLMQYLGDEEEMAERLNFFTAFEMLHFQSGCDDREFARLKQPLNTWLSKQIRSLHGAGESRTEAVLTCVEMLCNPKVEDSWRRKVLSYLEVPEDRIDSTIAFIHKQEDMFITWRNYKIDHEVAQFENNNVY